MPSYAEVIPDEYQAMLIAYSQTDSTMSWALGDLTDEILGKVLRSQPKVTRQFVYSAIGAFAGKSARTIREYHHITRLYPSGGVRERWPALSFDHFRTAAIFGDMRFHVLDWAVNQADEQGGRPATVDAMYAHFAGTENMVDADQEQEKAPAETRRLIEKFVPRMINHLQDLIVLMAGDENYVPRLQLAVDALKDVLLETEETPVSLSVYQGVDAL